MLSYFPRDVLDKILNLIESVFEGFPTYTLKTSAHIHLCGKEIFNFVSVVFMNGR